MKITEMSDKLKNNKGNFKPRNLDEVVAGGSSEDFVQDGDLVKIIEESKVGFYDERFGKNAVLVIMERCIKKDDGTIEGTGEAVQINLSAFDRSATPYKKEADGFTVRAGETVRADGDAVTSWKAAKSAKAFMTANNTAVTPTAAAIIITETLVFFSIISILILGRRTLKQKIPLFLMH